MITLLLMFILSIVSMYYFFKLRKIDKTKSENLSSLIILTPVVNNLLPIEAELKDMIILFMFSLSIVLLRKGLKDEEKKKSFYISEKNNLKE
ncbi:hypothetical protein SAMN02745120_1257 [Acetoanaerobium noterae]|uniref:Uncharacterized protein n=1 Tax=Acetoanaerobium noterae TaxID=745369 RepID=A0A1T5AXI2_9FIRM|nr:hypothetical protein [Acetoanaerobium noterae]SKB39684.1 hypothetical protein SAMN02745120_1257 [Acetoanaerobium noterae]